MSAPLFKADQIIQYKGMVSRYLVIGTPTTYTYNNLPSYLLKSLRPIATPPFFRSQVDVETHWESVED